MLSKKYNSLFINILYNFTTQSFLAFLADIEKILALSKRSYEKFLKALEK